MISRRELFAAFATAPLARSARADVDRGWRPNELDVREIFVQGSLSRRFVLGVPRNLAPGERVPLIVLLHGLGETGDERMGAWAWFERYGLGTSYDRLCASLSFRGLVLACPYMPNLPGGDPSAFDSYARWIALTVVPRARKEAPAIDTMRATYLAGCSLGGYFSLEVLLRQPETFGAWGGVQSALGQGAAAHYAERLAATTAHVGPRDLLIETSRGDPFRAGNEALARALTSAAVPNTFIELPGLHDQPWLRQHGTAAMLEWFANLPV
ncbi:MAG TPA: alpha/beta hydrolase-fold protein [Polyangiaceae bacterium]|nr:alpha/beta hydrolase-fold protein [Polyangiaceae bacterium]